MLFFCLSSSTTVTQTPVLPATQLAQVSQFPRLLAVPMTSRPRYSDPFLITTPSRTRLCRRIVEGDIA